MTAPTIGQKIDNFSLPATGDKQISLDQLKGKNIVLYFYPKDSTPGCTTEGQNFRDAIQEFEAHNAVILGVSRDTVRKHENFKEKQQFPFDLLADTEEALCKQFDVIKLKKNYGKEYMGIERSTFIINTEGELVKEWRKVKVPGHVEEVLDAIKAL